MGRRKEKEYKIGDTIGVYLSEEVSDVVLEWINKQKRPSKNILRILEQSAKKELLVLKKKEKKQNIALNKKNRQKKLDSTNLNQNVKTNILNKEIVVKNNHEIDNRGGKKDFLVDDNL